MWEKIYLLVMAAIIAVNVKTGFFLAAPTLLQRGDEVVFEYTITWRVSLLFVAVGWSWPIACIICGAPTGNGLPTGASSSR